MTDSGTIPGGITERGPQIFAGAGLLLMLLAAYMAGADAMACAREGDRVDCHVRLSRVLGLVTVERQDIPDVADVEVRTSTDRRGDASSKGYHMAPTTTNHTMYLITRGGQEFRALGGEESGHYADQVEGLLRRRSAVPISIVDSTWIVAGACGALGLVLFAFGAVAWRVTNAERQAAQPPTS